ncbi:Rho-type gtpase-activating protein [Coemansia erecta]|uniref:Rho-type gtpase-activating protein n=1 Tax=Coemansia erecta TaxID=147472 RepID=A0A9W7Y0P1_9FUNG|nr:Rho-type gtpase-activating protein [Coemansia erecta]
MDFQCTTCAKVIEFDSNLLFLADGKPICPECSYCCSLCKKPIFDEAIVTVEGTYHSECFRCTNCKQRIQGKSFAKTSQGVIYCVTCYAERRERKKAARRRREHQVLEEKMLPSLPAEAANGEPVSAAKSLDDGSSRTEPHSASTNANSPTPLTSSTVASSPSPGAQQQQKQQQQQQKQQASAGGAEDALPQGQDLRSRRRGVHNSTDFSGASKATNVGDDSSGNSLSLPLASRGTSAGSTLQTTIPYSSAPSTPVKSEGEIPAVPLTLANLNAADPSLDVGLAWTEDISALENNFVRFSMRTPLTSKPAMPKSPEATQKRNSRNKHETPKSLSRSSSVNHAQHRARAASSASALGAMVPPGLRSRENASHDTTSSQQSGGFSESINDPHILADSKEWLNNATVEQLKDELLVNYGQLCRMEASYQKLRDLYATIIDQLLQTRESLQQERSKRQEFESILRNFYGYVVTDTPANDAGTVKGSSGRHRGALAAGSGQILAAKQQQARGQGSRQKPDGGALPSMARQPSLRRQRQARKQEPRAADQNDSASDPEDAIITTVPQKATKRFMWPFGGGNRANGDEPSVGNHHGEHGSGGGGGEDSTQHSFHLASSFRASKCDHCQERLKTFSNTVVRCRNCGFVCHQRCAADVTATCSTGASGTAAGTGATGGGGASMFDHSVPFQPDKMFGRDLCEQTSLEGQSVPWVVRAAVGFIERQGLTMEGVYRRSGSTMDIRTVMVEILRVAENTDNKFYDAAIATPDMDVTSVTSVLKQYFRELPNPLMTSDTYHLWVHAAGIDSAEERIKVYRTISDSMPQSHSETLRFLMTHLKRVADNQAENKMTTNNLSVVFAPNILHMGKNDMLQEMANMSGINKTVSFLIQNADRIWGADHYGNYAGEADNTESGGEDNEMPSVSLVENSFMPSGATSNGGNSAAGPFRMPPAMKRNREVRALNTGLDGDAADGLSLSHSMPSPKGLYFGQQEALPSERVMPHGRAINNNSGGVYQKSSFDIPRNK